MIQNKNHALVRMVVVSLSICLTLKTRIRSNQRQNPLAQPKSRHNLKRQIINLLELIQTDQEKGKITNPKPLTIKATKGKIRKSQEKSVTKREKGASI